MSVAALTLSVETQVEILHPIFSEYCQQLVQSLSQKMKEDLSKTDWLFIYNEREMGDLHRVHMMTKAWQGFQAFFLGQSKLYCFVEKAQGGLVNVEAKLWFFFDPMVAHAWFQRQRERPKGFKKSAILPLPCLDLLRPIVQNFARITANQEMKLIDRINRNMDFLSLADFFLPQEKTQELELGFKRVIARLLFEETQQLQKDITNPGMTPSILEKRLRAVFQISWRFFRMENMLENAYFKKLLSKSIEDRDKGLRLTQKKIQDFEAQI